jgi:predicted RecB family nuclease
MKSQSVLQKLERRKKLRNALQFALAATAAATTGALVPAAIYLSGRGKRVKR